MRRFKGHQGARLGGDGAEQAATLGGAAGQEAQVDELVAGQAGDGQGGGNGRGAGDGNHGDAAFNRRPDQLVAGVGEARHARLADQGHVLLGQGLQQVVQLLEPAVLKEAGEGGVDVVAGQELACRARVFGGDEGHFPQHTQRSQGDVLQVADGSGDDV